MKKKNTMPERDWQQTNEKIRWRELRKRILVMGLTVAMVANTVDLSALLVSAKTDESETGKTTIVSFEELSKDITEQTLPIGALESDIKFPTSLTVTVEKTTQADEKEADDEEDDSETGDTEKDDAQKDDSNGDTASSDDKKDTASSDEKDGDSGNADASDKSGTSDNGNADTKDSDTSKDSGNSDKSNNPNGSSSSDTEDTQARADLPSAFGALIGQMADALLPHKLIVHAAEKDDASDTVSTSDVADNAKKTDTASTSDNADSVKTTGSSDAAASSDTETTTEKIRLENIKWELNVEESDAEEFDSSEASNGFCYAYTPVLPDEDGDGNQLVLGKGVELPTIYVLVGEYGIALLAGSGTVQITETNADGTKAPYTAQDLATWIDEHGSANLEKVSIKLLNDDTSITEELTIGTGLAKEIELDLNGHTLTLQGGNARLYFKRVNITITSSGSNKGTITGNYDYGNKLKGDGLVTADYVSILKIERVTIENTGTCSTVALCDGVTCTIDAASISGGSGEQAGTITVNDSKACTITNTEVTGNIAPRYGTITFTGSCSECIIGEGAVIKNKNENSGSYCVKVVDKYNVKITVEKDATLTSSLTIMDTTYSNVTVNIEGGTFNGHLRLPDNSQIAEGTFTPATASGNAIWVNNSKKTLQDLLKVGYTLKYEDGTYADLTARWTDEGRKVTAVKSPLYFTTHPTIASGAETVMENYTASEAPELTVKAESGSGSISYQWYADETINGTTKTKVEQTGQGAKTATYRIPTGLLAGTYQYYCVATCGEYTATSKKAAFTVEEGVAEVTVGGNTTRYATLTKAFDAVKATVNAADAEADLEITLKVLKDIFETKSEWKIDGGTKKVSFCMDLNGCTVTGKGLYITGEGVEAVFKGAGTGQNGTLNAPVFIQNKAKLTVENGNYKGVLRFVDGAAAKLKDGYYSSSIYIGKTEGMDNTDISCTITGGTYEGEEVLVCGGATLSVSGDTAKIKVLHIDHREFSQIKRAKVMLSGGKYGEIALSNFNENNDDSLLDEAHGYAIADTLAEGYAFYSAGIKTDISRTDRSQGSVEVLRADTPEDTSQAVVKFQIEKNSGETKTMYFLTWDAAMFYLEGSEEHRKNKEYKLWEKLEILLLKDTKVDKSISRMLNKVYLPAEITLRSEGNKPHTLKSSNENYLFITGGQDVIIENINVVGNIDFLGDTRGTQAQDASVLRLGERATGLENIEVIGNAEIVIEKGAEIPKTFTGGGGNLNASIYCNHDSADFSSKITQGAGAFKIWFPIELSGIALPTGGENDTNVTQRDGVTYGLYSNGGTTDQKIKVTGEVCSYEPYGGKAVTIDTTDLSFTMPSSKVTLKAHTKDDYGYCRNCNRTDLAEAYKKSRLIIEGLEGRIYDGYPQVMTGITLKTANGDVKLTGPEYKSGKELAQNSTDSANADITNADYTVVYENNIKCNENKESTDAPTAIITGCGAYYGTVAFKFAIGQGEMQVAGATAAATEYDGKAHTALADSDAISVTLKADKYDANAHIPVTDGYIAPCLGKKLATDGFDSEYMDTFPLQITCKGADGKAYGDANTYTVTNAGSYPFTIMVMAENNSCPSVVIPLTAEVSKKQITVVIADKEKFYGETNPALTWSLASGDAYQDNVLVADDTEEALVISLSTTAKDNSDVGTYAITGTSNSANYEVSFIGNGSDGKSGILTVKQAANSFTTELSCSDYTYAKDETPEPNATAKFGTVTYKYATAASDGTAYRAPSDESAYTDAIPVNAGIYAVKAYIAETENYAGLASDPVVFTINKAASPNIGDEEKSYSYVAGSDDKAISVDIARKLPTDRGTTTYAVAMTDTEQLLSEVTVDTAGNLTYKVNQVDSSKVGKTAIITVTASMENYANAGYTLTISITDKKTVEIKGGNSVSVDGSNVLIYGEKISKLTLGNTVFVEAGTDDAIGGILSWSNPDEIPAAGTTQAGWVFKPADSKHYEELTGTAAITVARATPAVVTVPAVAERVYNPAVALADSDMTGGSVTGADGNELAGTWSFTGKNIIPTVNNKGYQAVFTPDDANNYSTVTRTITVKVTKATPVIAEKPTAGALTYGQKLSDSTLTGGKAAYQTADGTEITGAFAWKNSSIKPTAADSQKTEYDVTFTPSDKDNYNAVDTKLALTVNKAAQAPNMPQASMAPAHSTKKVGDITLPDGWSWQEADKDTALADGVAVTANAIYTGADKGNYETESVSITITRSECDHTHTEIRNQQEATCKKEGYTGDTYCKDCGEKLATGTATVKKAHTVGTPATCVSKAVCSVCSETFGEVDATNHVHTTAKNRKEATCTQTGYAGDTYCTDCDKLLSTGKELAALGHDYKATVTKQPTTTEEGIRTYTCTRCNSSYTESIAKLPEEQHTHNYTGSITKEATCTEAGIRTYTCSCGDSYTENIPATGHSYVSKVTKAATTTEEGIMTYTCSKCGHSYTQPIAKIKSDDSNKDNGSQNQKLQSGTDNGNQNQKPQPDTDNGKEKGDSIKPYIKDDSGKEGWDVIKPQLEEAKSGDTVTVAMNGTTVVPKDVIDSIKGKDTTLVLDMGNGLSWKIYGKDITDAAGDIDFDVTVGADAGKSIPVDVINNVTGEHSSLNLTLAYDGEFGFTATLTVNMESKNAGLYANLFYYNEQTGELEFISAGQIDPDGNVELVFTHASDYTIVVDAKIMSDNGQADNKSDETIPAPKTDDSTSKYAWNNTIIIIIGICIILIVFGAVFYVRKKSGSEEE